MNRLIFFSSLFLCWNSFSQTQEENELLESLSIQNANDQERSVPWVDQGNFRKWDINKFNLDKLDQLEILETSKRRSLFEFLSNNRPILHLNELQTIHELEKNDLKTLSQIFYVSENSSFRDLEKDIWRPDISILMYRVKSLIQKKSGFQKHHLDGGFVGNPLATRLRFLHRKYGHYSFGFLSDKDPGEAQNAIIANPLSDRYLSAHAFVEGKGILKKLCLGDFLIQHGEGLVFSQGFALGKGPETIFNIKKPESGLRPYTSAFENGTFRGVAAGIELFGINITSYVSSIKRNSTIKHVNQPFSGTFQTFFNSDLFRTENEIRKRGSVHEFSIGGIISKKLIRKRLKLNLNIRRDEFSLPLSKTINSFQTIQAKQQLFASTSFSFSEKGLFGFGELAISGNGASAFILGGIFQIHKNWDLGVQARSFSSDYLNLNSKPFSEYGTGNNEKGIYTSLKWKPHYKLSIEGYFDLYSRLSPHLNDPFVSGGTDNLLHLKFKKSKSEMFRLIYKSEKRSTPGEEAKEMESTRYYGSYRKSLTQKTMIQTRVFLNRNKFDKAYSGFGLVQEVNLNFSKANISGLVGLFETDNHATAIYFFERNFFWEYSIPGFSGRGIHFNGLIKIVPIHRISIWMRINHTLYLDRKEIGSGLDRLNSNQKTEVGAMIRLSLF